jgi:DNA modification methylase
MNETNPQRIYIASPYSIAARLLGLDFVGCEIDRDYFNAQEKRFKDASGGEEIDLLLRSAPALWH